MAKRTVTLVFSGALLASGFLLFHQPSQVRAQQTSARLQVASFSVSTDQPLKVPANVSIFPDEHTTIIPPASASAPYYFWVAALPTGFRYGGSVLQTTDLQNFTVATGYNTQVMTSIMGVVQCNPTNDGEFDANYSAPDTVMQDPTLPAGNLIMLYEGENYCPGDVNQTAYYASTGVMRSSDNGKTWPTPEGGPQGGLNRYAVLQVLPSLPTAAHNPIGDATASGYIDKSLDGNYYLYASYTFNGTGEDGKIRLARGQLGQNTISFQKWYNGSFSQPGIAGLDSGPGSACPGYQSHSQISYNDDLGQYLMTLVCIGAQTGAWYYSTATSLDLQDWTPLQMIANSQYPVTTCNNEPQVFDGWYPSFMSPGAAAGHTKLTGMVFLMTGCETGAHTFVSRNFTITAQSQPAPALTANSLANGATYVAGGLVPGSWAQVKGTGLSNITRLWTGFDFLNLGTHLPTNLSGVQVLVNNLPAAVYYVSPTQVDFQVPGGVSGNASVQVVVNGTASNTVTATAPASSPGLFPNRVNGVNYPAAVFPDGHYVGDPSVNPAYRNARPGDAIELYGTGLVSQPGGVLPTAQAISGVTVTVGNVTVPADYAAQTPFVGEFQINFTVPQQFATLAAGNYAISISVNGVSSPTTINSSPPGQIVLPTQH